MKFRMPFLIYNFLSLFTIWQYMCAVLISHNQMNSLSCLPLYFKGGLKNLFTIMYRSSSFELLHLFFYVPCCKQVTESFILFA